MGSGAERTIDGYRLYRVLRKTQEETIVDEKYAL